MNVLIGIVAVLVLGLVFYGFKLIMDIRHHLNITSLALTDADQEFITGNVNRAENGQQWLTTDYKQLIARLDETDLKLGIKKPEPAKAGAAVYGTGPKVGNFGDGFRKA